MNKAIFPRCKNNNKTAINHATKKFVWNVIYNVRQINSKIFTFKVTFKLKFSFVSHAFHSFRSLPSYLGIKYSRKKVKTFPSRKKVLFCQMCLLPLSQIWATFTKFAMQMGLKNSEEALLFLSTCFFTRFFPYFYSSNFQHTFYQRDDVLVRKLALFWNCTAK